MANLGLMKIEDFKTERSQRQIAWLVLFCGLSAAGFGLFGIWIQGNFWDITTNYLAMADTLLHSEVVESFCLPSIVTLLGGLAIAWVILASRLTGKYSPKWRNSAFIIFVVVYVLAVFIPAKIAGDKMWVKALQVEKQYNTPVGVAGK